MWLLLRQVIFCLFNCSARACCCCYYNIIIVVVFVVGAAVAVDDLSVLKFLPAPPHSFSPFLLCEIKNFLPTLTRARVGIAITVGRFVFRRVRVAAAAAAIVVVISVLIYIDRLRRN